MSYEFCLKRRWAYKAVYLFTIYSRVRFIVQFDIDRVFVEICAWSHMCFYQENLKFSLWKFAVCIVGVWALTTKCSKGLYGTMLGVLFKMIKLSNLTMLEEAENNTRFHSKNLGIKNIDYLIFRGWRPSWVDIKFGKLLRDGSIWQQACARALNA